MANFWDSFERPVLGCIEADFCKYIRNTKYSFESSWRDLHVLHERLWGEKILLHLWNPTEKTWKALLLCLWNPIEKPRKALRASVRRTWHTVPRKRSYPAASAVPEGAAKRECTRARCSTFAPLQSQKCSKKIGLKVEQFFLKIRQNSCKCCKML